MGWFWLFVCTVFVAGTLIQMYYKASEDSKKHLEITTAELDALFWDYNRLRKQLGMETIHLTDWEDYYKSQKYKEDRFPNFFKSDLPGDDKTIPTIKRW